MNTFQQTACSKLAVPSSDALSCQLVAKRSATVDSPRPVRNIYFHSKSSYNQAFPCNIRGLFLYILSIFHAAQRTRKITRCPQLREIVEMRRQWPACSDVSLLRSEEIRQTARDWARLRIITAQACRQSFSSSGGLNGSTLRVFGEPRILFTSLLVLVLFLFFFGSRCVHAELRNREIFQLATKI